MEKPNGKRPRVEQLSKMACVACRRLKVRDTMFKALSCSPLPLDEMCRRD